ncbi:MAG: sensor histidine kinase [Alphaproteobacteria bacterium]
MTDGKPAPKRLRMFRTTAFKLSVIYLAVFTIFAAFLIGYIARNTGQLLTYQMREVVDAELKGLSEQYRIGGIRRLTRMIDRRSRRPGASLYLVADSAGKTIAGNVEDVPGNVLAQPDSRLRSIPYQRFGDDSDDHHMAMVRVFELPGGYRVLVGRDIGERERFAEIIRRSMFWTLALMVVLGLASWLFVSRRVLKRIDSVAATSQQIIAGDLSGRLEVTGTGDEFDRLADSLNDMLDRIERLMTGLKQVSDNIAHDLKTPLTRMRNRVESALSGNHDEQQVRTTLQDTIDDADQLIRTFNALLSIARVEAGSSDAPFGEVDAAAIAADVVDLYEPAADEAGVSLSLHAPQPVTLSANRELLSQALANLVDNAIKHTASADAQEQSHTVQVAVSQSGDEIRLVVADNGPGIAGADHARVTERFVRLEASRTKPGVGLGLSLVSAVAKLHGGRFVMEDNNPGLRAVLILPRRAPEADGG